MYLCLRRIYWTLQNKNISYFTIMWYADNMIEINQKIAAKQTAKIAERAVRSFGKNE